MLSVLATHATFTTLHQTVQCTPQDYIPPRHTQFWNNRPTMNTNHVIKTYMHKTEVKVACQIAKTVQPLALCPTGPRFGVHAPPSSPQGP